MSKLAIITTIGALMMGILAIIIRVKSAKYPATAKKIILPPVFMSTGFSMFFFVDFPPFIRVVESCLAGMFFSIFLIKTTKFEIREGQIYLKRSKAFMFILLGLLVARILLKLIVGGSIDVFELGGMFFILAFSMILPWRIAMFVSFKKLERKIKAKQMFSSAFKT